MSAVISECGRYRYRLERMVNMHGDGVATFVMLNPSTADATSDDPTIRRCIGFASAWGCRQLVVVNLFALRATDPRQLRGAVDPVGPENITHWGLAVEGSRFVVCAWGDSGKAQAHVLATEFYRRHLGAAPMMCLGVTRRGSPRHPLYVKADTPLITWDGPL